MKGCRCIATNVGRLCDGLGIAARQTEPKLNNDKKMKVTSCRLIFKCQPEQKMMDVKMLMAYSSASLLQNRMLYAAKVVSH